LNKGRHVPRAVGSKNKGTGASFQGRESFFQVREKHKCKRGEKKLEARKTRLGARNGEKKTLKQYHPQKKTKRKSNGALGG